MPATFIQTPAFPLLSGEQLYRLDSGELVTVQTLRVESEPAFIAFRVTGRQLEEDGSPRAVQGPFDAAPGVVTLPAAAHTIANAALANGITTMTDAMTQWTAKALADWAGYLAAHRAVLNFPTA